ncbi:MAG TPA: alkaline phosphatase family protein [Pyrinomonadaceae bacterium]|nr:alkaline phosphatase family protein [Pyrinomonadaceae bacterium]
MFVLAMICFVCFPNTTSGACRIGSPAAADWRRPRLVLVVVADQFRYDYLDRFGDLFGTNGLRRLMQNGASWIDANYDQVPTYTAPDHAAIMTGAYPALTGIVANEWPDRETGKVVSSVSDADATLFAAGPEEEGASPCRLMASTVGDELRLATNDRAKVIGISVKNRAAILPAGRHGNAAYWVSQKSGAMVSSNYYFSQLPSWVTSFNAKHPEDKFFGAKWERLLPEREYLKRAGPDAPPWEKVKSAADTNAFPHIITGGVKAPGEKFYTALEVSPFTSDILVAFAKEAITNEQLGADEDTDILSISFSANDYVGHRYGPYSQEVMDVTLRFDQQLGELLDFVDSRVGLSNTIIVFTADHGVAPIPEHSLALGLTGGRIKAGDLLAAMRAGITDRFNPQHQMPDRTADYILKYRDGHDLKDALINGNLYFDREALKRDGVKLDEVERVACEAAMSVRGIARCYTRTQIQQSPAPDSDFIGRRVQHGFYSSRSGDLVLITSPFYLEGSETATHGTPYSYDTHVPLVLMGPGIVPGRYLQSANPMDIAPTLAALLKVQPPSNSAGRILLEGIQH